MTRINKIVKLKTRPIDNRIDLHKCSDQDLDKLIEIQNLQEKSIPKSAKDWQFIHAMVENQKLGIDNWHTKPPAEKNFGEPIGRHSK